MVLEQDLATQMLSNLRINWLCIFLSWAHCPNWDRWTRCVGKETASLRGKPVTDVLDLVGVRN